MAEHLTPAQVVEIVRENRRQRWQKGERVPAEDYLAQYPSLQQDPSTALELAYHEVLLREEMGEEPQLEEYLRRFPQFQSELQPLFEVHQALEAGNLVDTPIEGTIAFSTAESMDDGRKSGALPKVPGFEILDLLGRGGMGVVYRARQLRLNRIVALKMIQTGAGASPKEMGRFRAEAEVQARLQHPNIVQIFEVGEAEGCPYFALEYVSGGSLEKYLGGRPLPQQQAAQFVETLARAVHYAHQNGILHRDLKPGNILLSGEWRVMRKRTKKTLRV
jgi:eukaryotic-like serine/threonine-protein kinase